MGVIKDRKIAIKNLNKLVEDPSKVLFIHYSQSRTFEEDDYGNISPIITSIVIKSLDGHIDKQFAIHFEADKADIPKDQIQDSYRELELRILKLYNEFIKRNSDCSFVHWDMKNIHFGFEAIRHRYEKVFENLNNYVEIPGNKKQNLRLILEGMYGENFSKGPDYLKSLLEFNSDNLSDPNYLMSSAESQEFENKNFEVVIKSVDVKVEFIKKATKKLCDRKLLIVNKNRYAVFIDFVNHPVFTFIGWLATIIGLAMAIYTVV